jgi:hypothetical protein
VPGTSPASIPAAAASPSTGAAPSNSRRASQATVFLAEATSDVREWRDALRRDLQQHGYRVLPDRPIPYEHAEAAALTAHDLAQSRLAVHIFGRNYGVVPEGSTTSMAELQYELAAERAGQGSFARLVWIPPAIPADDERQRALLGRIRVDPRLGRDADLLEAGFEEFRTAVQDWLSRDLRPAVATAAPAGAVPQIYFIADQRDVERITPWCDALFEQHLEVIQPMFDGDESDIRAFHEETLSTCDACLIFYGAGNELWLRRKLREIQKSPGYGRTKPAPLVWIAQIGPRTPEKERFRTHEAIVVPQWDGVRLDDLRPLVTQLKAGRPA